MNTQEKVLKVLTLAFQQQDPTSQKQVAEWVKEVQELGEQASEEALLAIQYLQQLQSEAQKAKKGTKIKQKPLIKKKTYSSHAQKGEKGFTANKCHCVLHRIGGSIIEVDSCTGLPFVKKGKKVVKASDGTAAWYNTTAKQRTDQGADNQVHYFQNSEGKWQKQQYTNNAWGEAEDFDIAELDDTTRDAFYKNAYATGYSPHAAQFDTYENYQNALNQGANYKTLTPETKIINGTKFTYDPSFKGATTQEFSKDGIYDGIGAVTSAEVLSPKAQRIALRSLRTSRRRDINDKNWVSKLNVDGNDVFKKVLNNTYKDKTFNELNNFQKKRVLRNYYGTDTSVRKLLSGDRENPSVLGRIGSNYAKTTKAVNDWNAAKQKPAEITPPTNSEEASKTPSTKITLNAMPEVTPLKACGKKINKKPLLKKKGRK